MRGTEFDSSLNWGLVCMLGRRLTDMAMSLRFSEGCTWQSHGREW